MKRGQGALAVVIGLGVLAAIMIVVAFVIKPGVGATGRALYVPEEGLAEQNSEFVNFVPYPFELRAWTVNADGVRLDVKNIGDEDYAVKVLEIEGCGTRNQNIVVEVGESDLLSVDCSLKEGSEFEGKFSFAYTPLPTGEAGLIRGTIKDLV